MLLCARREGTVARAAPPRDNLGKGELGPQLVGDRHEYIEQETHLGCTETVHPNRAPGLVHTTRTCGEYSGAVVELHTPHRFISVEGHPDTHTTPPVISIAAGRLIQGLRPGGAAVGAWQPLRGDPPDGPHPGGHRRDAHRLPHEPPQVDGLRHHLSRPGRFNEVRRSRFRSRPHHPLQPDGDHTVTSARQRLHDRQGQVPVGPVTILVRLALDPVAEPEVIAP